MITREMVSNKILNQEIFGNNIYKKKIYGKIYAFKMVRDKVECVKYLQLLIKYDSLYNRPKTTIFRELRHGNTLPIFSTQTTIKNNFCEDVKYENKCEVGLNYSNYIKIFLNSSCLTYGFDIESGQKANNGPKDIFKLEENKLYYFIYIPVLSYGLPLVQLHEIDSIEDININYDIDAECIYKSTESEINTHKITIENSNTMKYSLSNLIDVKHAIMEKNEIIADKIYYGDDVSLIREKSTKYDSTYHYFIMKNEEKYYLFSHVIDYDLISLIYDLINNKSSEIYSIKEIKELDNNVTRYYMLDCYYYKDKINLYIDINKDKSTVAIHNGSGICINIILSNDKRRFKSIDIFDSKRYYFQLITYEENLWIGKTASGYSFTKSFREAFDDRGRVVMYAEDNMYNFCILYDNKEKRIGQFDSKIYSKEDDIYIRDMFGIPQLFSSSSK